MSAKPAIQPGAIISRNTGLDSLRAIFALGVLVSHVELMKAYNKLDSLVTYAWIAKLGRIGVTGFFVLSGFLITVHLLQMRDSEGTTGNKVKTFYFKRILRIWPLYYAVILLCLYVFPHIAALHFAIPEGGYDARENLGSLQYYYLFLLPHIPLAMNTVLPFAEPSWSIGVEEIFYLLVPLLIFTTKRLQTILIALGLVFILGRYIVFANSAKPYEELIPCLFYVCQYECIIIGCLAGLWYYEQKAFIKYINQYWYWIAIALLVILTATIPHIQGQYYHFALLFAIVILYTAMQPKVILDNKVLQFYGRISFSLYMTHEIVIVFLLNQYDFSDYHPVLFHIVCLTGATALGFVTYKLIEEPFLKMKNKVKISSS
jgi:peptidoglycan/LPS O-acetylase OafA/YrhL